MKLEARNRPITAGDVMRRGVIVVRPDMSVKGLANLLTTEMITGAPVVDEHGNVVGVVSLFDVAAYAGSNHGAVIASKRDFYNLDWPEDDDSLSNYCVEDFSDDVCVSDIMSTRLQIVSHVTPIEQVVRRMLDNRIHRVLVKDGNSLIGIITSTDLLHLLL